MTNSVKTITTNLKNMNEGEKRRAFKIWASIFEKDRLKKKFFEILLKSTYGRVNKFYSTWESLPERKKDRLARC